METKKRLPYIIAGIVFFGTLPVVLFWACFGRVPGLSAEDARRVLLNRQTPALLIDVRQPPDFQRQHIDGSVNRPFADIMRMDGAGDMPAQWRGHSLLFICEAGFKSARAARKVQSFAVSQSAYNVRGGIQTWLKGGGDDDQVFYRFKTASGETQPFPIVRASWLKQFLVCAAAFCIKPLYMLLSLMLIWVLRQQRAVDLRVLKWAFISFLTGETFCAVNYIFFGEDSYLVEYLHMFGMVGAFGLSIYAFINFVDFRLLHISDTRKKCAAQQLCAQCIKYTETPCGFTRMLSVFSFAILICAFIPLCAVPHTDAYLTDIFGTLYPYTHPVVYQYFEIRYAPILAGLFFAAAFLLLINGKTRFKDFGVVFFSAGSGFLGFSMFRLILFSAYRQDLSWFVIWEELTELLYIVGVGVLLWLFRHGLLENKEDPF